MAMIEKVNSPRDIKKLTKGELSIYAAEVRELIVETVKNNGGHLSSNLGSVELTIALHYVFNSPEDKILFDVGHQAYTHKIITGRRDNFSTLRCDGGISGFPNINESEHDAFTTGHSSTSLSVGLGMARARDMQGKKHSVVSIIGDGAFTGGMAFEALNDIGSHKERMIIILNDNEMSISKNVGAFSEYLSKLRLSRRYTTLKKSIKNGARALPFFGDEIAHLLDKAKDSVKISLLPNKIFENLGVKYYGPVDGHDIPGLIDVLSRLKLSSGPVLLHVVTKKGMGVEEVMQSPDKYHGVSPKVATNSTAFSGVVSTSLCNAAKSNQNVVAVTAAMSSGTGLEEFSKQFPERYFDVGIAEQHAVSMCSGFASCGIKPYFAVYSSFLQRAYDQILHDVCIDSRPVTFLIDHAGVVGGDGVTHQGLFDISYLSSMPNMTVLQPKDGEELARMIDFSLGFDAPLAIRYPKDFSVTYGNDKSSPLSWELLRKGDLPVTILAVGNRMIDLAMRVNSATIVNARCIKPLDTGFLSKIKNKIVITLEDGVKKGGFGESVRAYFVENNSDIRVEVFAHPDKFVSSVSESAILTSAGFTAENLNIYIKKALQTLV